MRGKAYGDGEGEGEGSEGGDARFVAGVADAACHDQFDTTGPRSVRGGGVEEEL